MFYYTVFYRDLEISNKEVSLFTKNIRSFLSEKRALIEALICNFEYIEEHDPFYDDEDQIGNNYFFKDTPRGLLRNYNLDWRTAQELNTFVTLWNMDINTLYSILSIQKYIITPTCDKKIGLYSHKYTGLKKYNCSMLNKQTLCIH